jgi:plasmid stabilization system protein ParE
VPRRVIVATEALRDLDEIRAYLMTVSPKAERRVGIDFDRALALLENFPEIGRKLGDGRRQLSSMTPYLIRYRIEGDLVVVISIRHGARAPEDPSDA